MTAPITQAMKPDRLAANIAKARKVADAAAAFAKSLERSGGQYLRRQLLDELDLCEAAIDLWDDGDALAQKEAIYSEMGWDSEGFPVEPLAGFTARELAMQERFA